MTNQLFSFEETYIFITSFVLGFDMAGFETVVVVEYDKSCCNTLRKNNPELSVIHGDVSQISTKEILETERRENRMLSSSRSINQYSSGKILNCANLTIDNQLNSLCNWLVKLK